MRLSLGFVAAIPYLISCVDGINVTRLPRQFDWTPGVRKDLGAPVVKEEESAAELDASLLKGLPVKAPFAREPVVVSTNGMGISRLEETTGHDHGHSHDNNHSDNVGDAPEGCHWHCDNNNENCHLHCDDDDNHDHDSPNKVWSHIGALLTILLAGVLGAWIPYGLKSMEWFAKIMPFTLAFAGGAFLGLAILHILPESILFMNRSSIGISIGDSEYSALYPLIVVGYLIVLLCEKVFVPMLARGDKAAQVAEHTHHISLDPEKGHVHDVEIDPITKAHDPKGFHENEEPPKFSAAALLAALSIALHGVFEGMIVGLLGTHLAIWAAALSIIGHKWAETFVLGISCIRRNVKMSQTIFFLSIVALASPLGIGIGMIARQATDTYNGVVGVLTAIALGTILYTACDIIADVMSDHHKSPNESKWNRLWLFLCILAGVCLLFGLMALHLVGHVHTH